MKRGAAVFMFGMAAVFALIHQKSSQVVLASDSSCHQARQTEIGFVIPSDLTASCDPNTPKVTLQWNAVPVVNTNGIIKARDSESGAFIGSENCGEWCGDPNPPGPQSPPYTYTYVDTHVEAGHKYSYRVKNHPAVCSNVVVCDFTSSPPSSQGPRVATLAATDVSDTKAMFNGTVNPNGLSTTIWFEYGTSQSLGNMTQSKNIGSGTATLAISEPFTGLQPGATYYYRIVGQNVNGVSRGTILKLKSGAQPTAVTEPATEITANSARLNGTVNPNGIVTLVRFEYGDDINKVLFSSGNTSVSGNQPGPVQALMTDLEAGKTYYYRVVAQNSFGTAYGNTLRFTAGQAAPGTANLTIEPRSATVLVGETVSFAASFDPDASGLEQRRNVTLEALWDSSDARIASYEGRGKFRGRGEGRANISVSYNGVTAQGTLTVQRFKAAPSVKTTFATNVTLTSVTLNGIANPNGLSTTAWFEYGETQSLGKTTKSQSLGSGNAPVAISRSLINLPTGITYYYRIVARNSKGVANGEILSTSAKGAPTLTVNPETQTVKSGETIFFTVMYDLDGPSDLSPPQDVTKDAIWISSNAFLASHQGGGAFHVQGGGGVVITAYYNDIGSEYHIDDVGTLSAQASLEVHQASVAPLAETSDAVEVTAEAAVLQGIANPNGFDTQVWFEYGTSEELGQATADQSIGKGSSPVEVRISVAQLAPGTTYYYRLAAQNTLGIGYGGILTLTTSGGAGRIWLVFGISGFVVLLIGAGAYFVVRFLRSRVERW